MKKLSAEQQKTWDILSYQPNYIGVKDIRNGVSTSLPPNLQAGTFYFDTNTHILFVYTNSTWVAVQ